MFEGPLHVASLLLSIMQNTFQYLPQGFSQFQLMTVPDDSASERTHRARAACEACHRSKAKCDEKQPCGNCANRQIECKKRIKKRRGELDKGKRQGELDKGKRLDELEKRQIELETLLMGEISLRLTGLDNNSGWGAGY